MSEHPERRRSELLRCLQVLSREEGIFRPNLVELLKGDLRALQDAWHLNLENDSDDVRRAVANNLKALIVQLTPRQTRQELSLEQRKMQYQDAVAISFNISNRPESRNSKLQDRRSLLASKERGSLQMAVTTSQRTLNHAIDQMATLLTRADYVPAQSIDNDAAPVSPLAPPQAAQQPSPPKGRESFVERAANRFSLELRALKNLVVRVGKRIEEEWRAGIRLFVLAALGAIVPNILIVKTRSVLPVWHEPFRTLGEVVENDVFGWIIIAILVYPCCPFIFGMRYRVHIWISAIITCVACGVMGSILVADARDTDSYEEAMEEVARWQQKDSLSFDADGKCPSLPALHVAPPPAKLPSASGAVERRFPYGRSAGYGELIVRTELDHRFCEQKGGALNLQTREFDTSALPGNGGRDSDRPIYAQVFSRPFIGTAWTDCGIAAVPRLNSTVSTVPSFGLEFVNDEAGPGYRPVVSLATEKNETVVARSSIVLPYDDNGEFADSPRDGWLKMAVLRKGQQYTFFVNDRLVLTYDWPETWPHVHLSIQTHLRDGRKPSQDLQDLRGCQFDDFDYWTQPSN